MSLTTLRQDIKDIARNFRCLVFSKQQSETYASIQVDGSKFNNVHTYCIYVAASGLTKFYGIYYTELLATVLINVIAELKASNYKVVSLTAAVALCNKEEKYLIPVPMSFNESCFARFAADDPA